MDQRLWDRSRSNGHWFMQRAGPLLARPIRSTPLLLHLPILLPLLCLSHSLTHPPFCRHTPAHASQGRGADMPRANPDLVLSCMAPLGPPFPILASVPVPKTGTV
ncbi:hypothetical protein LZ31DRAFT_205783 [Colletotrichum somersetense]|nr:hypothetical protein LZ31DRAFT_205783 [Colletotrichum somersetense]